VADPLLTIPYASLHFDAVRDMTPSLWPGGLFSLRTATPCPIHSSLRSSRVGVAHQKDSKAFPRLVAGE